MYSPFPLAERGNRVYNNCMKNLVYLNNVAIDYKTLYARAQNYFHRHGVEIQFDFELFPYKNSYIKRQFPQGERIILQPTMAQIVPIDISYDFTSFVFNGRDFTPPNIPTGYTYCPLKQPFMDILTDPLNPPDLDYVTICHEMMHALTIKANQAGFPTLDQMDTYYNAMLLESVDSNFGKQWALLQPYVKFLASQESIVTITRQSNDHRQIMGILRSSDGKFGCCTLELAYNNNQHDISSIPTGIYECIWSYMNDLKEYHYQVMNVPNRTGIFLHEGNYATGKKIDIQGCILLGGAYSDIDGNGEPDIINSRIILNAFENFMGKKQFQLVIK